MEYVFMFILSDLKNTYYGAGISTIGPIVYEIFNNTVAWRPFIKMAATAHIGTVSMATISEMSCIGMIIMCAKRHKFTMICTIRLHIACYPLHYVGKFHAVLI